MNDHPEYPPTHPDQEPDPTPADLGNEACNPPAATPGSEPIGSDSHLAASPNPHTDSDDNSPEPTDQTQSGLTEDDNHRVQKLKAKAVATNTRLNYGYQCDLYASWARDRGIEPFPAKPANVAAYLAERAEVRKHKPATLRAAVAAISFAHKSAKLENPCDSEEVRDVISGATRDRGTAQKQAHGLTARALKTINRTLYLPRIAQGGNYESREAARKRATVDNALISLMRDGMLRSSEAAALTWDDLEEADHGTGRIKIKRSKTDQEGEGFRAFVSRRTMRLLSAMREDAQPTDSIFRLQRNQISRRIKRAAQSAGLGDGFSGHSPRIGMAQDLAEHGTEMHRLMVEGRWKSSRMPAHYTQDIIVSRRAVAQYYGYHDGSS